MIIGITVFVTALLLFIPAFSDFFKFDLVSTKQIALSIAVGGISVLWIEIYKGIKRMKKQ
jgi:Ca2+-transporting ATPase